jgi:hypothetical protein
MKIAALLLLLASAAAKDPYPKACVDCHKGPTKLSVMLAKPNPALAARVQPFAPKGTKLTGKHPAIAFAFKDVPAKCMPCHSATAKTTAPMPKIMHTLHAGMDCTNCHKFDPKTAEQVVPSGPEQ